MSLIPHRSKREKKINCNPINTDQSSTNPNFKYREIEN